MMERGRGFDSSASSKRTTPTCFPVTLCYRGGLLMHKCPEYVHMREAAKVPPIWGLVILSTLLTIITVPILIILVSR